MMMLMIKKVLMIIAMHQISVVVFDQPANKEREYAVSLMSNCAVLSVQTIINWCTHSCHVVRSRRWDSWHAVAGIRRLSKPGIHHRCRCKGYASSGMAAFHRQKVQRWVKVANRCGVEYDHIVSLNGAREKLFWCACAFAIGASCFSCLEMCARAVGIALAIFSSARVQLLLCRYSFSSLWDALSSRKLLLLCKYSSCTLSGTLSARSFCCCAELCLEELMTWIVLWIRQSSDCGWGWIRLILWKFATEINRSEARGSALCRFDISPYWRKGKRQKDFSHAAHLLRHCCTTRPSGTVDGCTEWSHLTITLPNTCSRPVLTITFTDNMQSTCSCNYFLWRHAIL